jgi:hypothetical protein
MMPLGGPIRVVEIGNRDIEFPFVEIGGAAHVVERLIGLQPDRFAGVRDHLDVIALLVSADRQTVASFSPENTFSAMI